MKKTLATLVLITASLFTAQAQQVPQIVNILGRKTTSLNGSWHYIVDVQEEGYYDYRMNPTQSGFFRNAKPKRPEDLIEYDFDKAEEMTIPSDWNTRDERLFFYEGTVWFYRKFNLAPNPSSRRLLYFGAVNYDSHVYVNGKHVGHHVGGFTPFNFDVTDLLKEGENFVIVKVDNKRHAEDVPTQIFDWWNYGGITRDVLLVDVPPTYVENYSLQLLSLEDSGLGFTVQLNKAVAGHQVTLNIPELQVKKTFTTDAEGKIIARFSPIAGKRSKQQSALALWSPENPKLT